MNSKNPNHILLFILDAVRKDHLSLYGYKRKISPNIDKLSKQSNVYNFAFAPSSYTLASVPSILSGKYPFELSTMFTGNQLTDQDMELLLKLKKDGYKTAMFTANIVTSSQQINLYKYFDFFWDDLTEKELNRNDMLYQKAEIVLKSVKDFVEKNKNEKLFVVIHLMEAHGPYTPWIESIFKNDIFYKKDKRKIERVVNDMFLGVDQKIIDKFKVAPRYQLLNLIIDSNEVIEDYNPSINEYISKYDMGIYLMDKELGNFFSFLKNKDIFNKSRIIITSDHGELLGEENIFFAHGSVTNPFLTNVPLIIKEVNQKVAKKINNDFSLIDLLENKKRQVIVSHPQSFSFIYDNHYLEFHNGFFTHNGSTNQNLFITGDLNLEQNIDNFVNFDYQKMISVYKIDRKNHSFKKTKNYSKKILSEMLDYAIFIQKQNFFNLKFKLTEFIKQEKKKMEEEIEKENEQLRNQIKETKIHINNLENTLNMIKSAKFFKLWQFFKGSCLDNSR